MKRSGIVGSLMLVALLGTILLGGCGTSNTSSGTSSAGASTSSPSSNAPSSTQRGSSGVTHQGSQASKKPGGEKVAPKENHPTGDIPDTQAFVTYTSNKGHYKLVAPEGWSRTAKSGNVSFVNKLDGMSVTLDKSAKAPTVTSVRKSVVPALKKAGRAVRIGGLQGVKLPAGPAVLIKYTSNSEPNPVTGKQVRLEDNSYVFYKNGKLAVLRLYAPLGADNVDQWHRISNSFRWV